MERSDISWDDLNLKKLGEEPPTGWKTYFESLIKMEQQIRTDIENGLSQNDFETKWGHLLDTE